MDFEGILDKCAIKDLNVTNELRKIINEVNRFNINHQNKKLHMK